jgi:hypothetical protein
MDQRNVFRIMLGFLFSHELDATLRHEWRVLPITSFLPDEFGQLVFIWLHVPLFFLILSFMGNSKFRNVMALFSVIHVGLHWIFRNHPDYEFNNLSSWSLILGAGFFGTAFLAMRPRD